MCFFVRTYFVFNINDGKQTRCYTGSYWSRVYQSIFPIECVLTTKFVFTWVKFLFIHNVLWLIQSCFFFRNLLLAFLLLISSFFCFVKFFYIFCCYLYREKLEINKRVHLKVSGMYYFSPLTDITSNMCTFCVRPVFPLDILFMLLQHLLCTYPVVGCFISFAYTRKGLAKHPGHALKHLKNDHKNFWWHLCFMYKNTFIWTYCF